MKSSLKLRLALLVGVLGLLQGIAVLAFSYATLKKELDGQQRAILLDKAQQARQLLGSFSDKTTVKANAFRLVGLVDNHPELHLVVASANTGDVYVAFSPEALESLGRLRHDTWGTDAFLAWRARVTSASMLSYATSGKTGDSQPYELVVTADRANDARLLRSLLLTAATAAPFAVALVSLAALIVVTLGLKPLSRLERAVAGVTAQTLGGRLDTATLPGELSSLATAFNDMLNRLDDSVSRLSRFSADVAHEMRTPLSILLGRTQVALSRPRHVEELVSVLGGNVEEIQRMSRMVTDMLFLAQAESAGSALAIESLRLDDEARHVAEFMEPAARERDATITVAGSAVAAADRGLVRRALTNLLSNATRHCTTGSEIRIAVAQEGTGASLSVSNEGVVPAREHLDRLFDRFYRVDSARARDGGGAGLGLTIVQAIMHVHHGSANVSAAPEGRIKFTLKFPAV